MVSSLYSTGGVAWLLLPPMTHWPFRPQRLEYDWVQDGNKSDLAVPKSLLVYDCSIPMCTFGDVHTYHVIIWLDDGVHGDLSCPVPK